MKTLLQDWPRSLKSALRFRVSALMTLVLISACALKHKPPPYLDPDRLVKVIKTAPKGEEPILTSDFLELRNQSRTLGPIAAYASRALNLTGGTDPERAFSGMVATEFFQALGVQPVLGRVFLPEECKSGRNHVVVISYNLWQRRFGGAPTMIGSAITLDQEKYTVIGVMAQGLQLPDNCDMWTPLVLDDESLSSKENSFHLKVIARLKTGVTMQQAEADMAVIARKLEKDYPDTNSGRSLQLAPLN